MALYKCDCGKHEKEIRKQVIVLRDGNWITKGSECPCGLYMKTEPVEGFPTLKRTEESLSKKKRHDKLWDGAKEKLLGERGINEPFD
tara:strand:- start:38 stop:298 length:261 start_codon:yes stop_codon:yes gene_type:complete